MYVYFPILVVQILSFRCDIVPVFTIPIVSLTVMYNSIHLINDANGVLLGPSGVRIMIQNENNVKNVNKLIFNYTVAEVTVSGFMIDLITR